MSDDKRRQTRTPNFRYAKLTPADGGEGAPTYPIILRDASSQGVGAMYIGKDVLNSEVTHLLKDSEGGERRVRIVWTKQVADFVQMLGMTFED